MAILTSYACCFSREEAIRNATGNDPSTNLLVITARMFDYAIEDGVVERCPTHPRNYRVRDGFDFASPTADAVGDAWERRILKEMYGPAEDGDSTRGATP